jgi:hypothetical protein
MRILVLVIFSLLAASLQASELIRCGSAFGAAGDASMDREDWHLANVTQSAFRKTFAGARAEQFKDFEPVYGRPEIDSVEMFTAADVDAEDPVFTLRVGVEIRSGASVRRLQLVDRHGTPPRMSNQVPGGAAPEVRMRSGLAVSPDEPILRVDVREWYVGAHADGHVDTAIVLDLREAAPRVAVVSCNEGWMGGACTAHDALYSPKGSTRCSWSDENGDFVCTSIRIMDSDRGSLRGVRRHELLSKKSLAAPDALASLDELKAQSQVAVQDIGTLEWIFTASTPRGEIRFFVVPSSTHRMTIRLVAVHPGGRVEEVPVRILSLTPDVDSGAFVAFDDAAAEIGYDLVTRKRFVRTRYTLAPSDHEFRARRIAAYGSMKTYAVVLAEGRRRALFWVGVDTASRAAKIDALRVASTSAEYGGCNQFTRPASIASASWHADQPVADVVIEPGYVEYWVEGNDFGVRKDCAVPATIRWSRDRGFVVEAGEKCLRLAQSVAIDDDGAVHSVHRVYNEDAQVLTKPR